MNLTARIVIECSNPFMPVSFPFYLGIPTNLLLMSRIPYVMHSISVAPAIPAPLAESSPDGLIPVPAVFRNKGPN